MEVGEFGLQVVEVALNKSLEVLQTRLLTSDDVDFVLLDHFFQILQGEIIRLQSLFEHLRGWMVSDVCKKILHKLLLNGLSLVEFGLLRSTIGANNSPTFDERLQPAFVPSGDIRDA